MPSMQFQHPPRRRPLSAAPKSCRMPRGRAQGCGSVRLAFSRPTAHPAPVVGAASLSARGTLRRRGVRRDEGIPPYGRPGGGGHSGWPKTQKLFVGAGFTAPAGAFRRPTAVQRRLLGRRSRPQASAPPQGSRDDASIVPYRGCGSVRLAFSRPTTHPAPVVGADSISARGALFRRGVRRDEGIPPYGRPGGGGHSGCPKT